MASVRAPSAADREAALESLEGREIQPLTDAKPDIGITDVNTFNGELQKIRFQYLFQYGLYLANNPISMTLRNAERTRAIEKQKAAAKEIAMQSAFEFAANSTFGKSGMGIVNTDAVEAYLVHAGIKLQKVSVTPALNHFRAPPKPSPNIQKHWKGPWNSRKKSYKLNDELKEWISGAVTLRKSAGNDTPKDKMEVEFLHNLLNAVERNPAMKRGPYDEPRKGKGSTITIKGGKRGRRSNKSRRRR